MQGLLANRQIHHKQVGCKYALYAYCLCVYTCDCAAVFQETQTRKTNENDQHVVSPVDGKVVVIEEVYEPEYFKDKRLPSIYIHVTNQCARNKIRH